MDCTNKVTGVFLIVLGGIGITIGTMLGVQHERSASPSTSLPALATSAELYRQVYDSGYRAGLDRGLQVALEPLRLRLEEALVQAQALRYEDPPYVAKDGDLDSLGNVITYHNSEEGSE